MAYAAKEGSVMYQTISNADNVIDPRQVIARIEDLTSLRLELRLDLIAADLRGDSECEAARGAIIEWNAEFGAELQALCTLQGDAGGESWRQGETLIRDSYFGDYAREFADAIGAVDKHVSWPHTCIDWDLAASELLQECTPVDFDGVKYWIHRN